MDQEKIWEHFQGDKGLSAFSRAEPRYRFIASKIKKNKCVLNIGVGNGGLEKLLQEHGAKVSCLDPSENAIERIRTNLSLGKQAKVGYSQNIPFNDNSFDYVIMSEVLEHLDDEVLKRTISEVKRVLREGGKFIGTVPPNEDLFDGKVICPCCGSLFHRWGHVQSFSPLSLKKLLLENNFSSVGVHYRAFSDWRRPGVNSFIKSFFRWGLGIFGANIALPNLYFEAKKTTDLND